MTRYRLTVEYDGGPFRGFQTQADLPTVQAEIERAVAAFSGERVRLHGAGRTDTGVHAAGQVIHFDLERDWPAAVVMKALNAHLASQPIAVVAAGLAAADFHARFSALGRRYLYRILNRPGPPALERGRVWHVKATARSAGHGRGGPAADRHPRLQQPSATPPARLASPVKTLDTLEVRREGKEVRLTFAARSFLHRQVRSLVGSLAQVGLGRWPAQDLAAALAARDRARCGPALRRPRDYACWRWTIPTNPTRTP